MFEPPAKSHHCRRMTLNLETTLWGLVLLDSIVYNGLAWTNGGNWYARTFPRMARQFPIARGFGLFYLVLVGWLGCVLYRLSTE